MPGEASLQGIDDVGRFPQAVSFTWIAEQDRFDADLFQRDVHLLGFLNRHVLVELTMDEHRRRLGPCNVSNRRTRMGFLLLDGPTAVTTGTTITT